MRKRNRWENTRENCPKSMTSAWNYKTIQTDQTSHKNCVIIVVIGLIYSWLGIGAENLQDQHLSLRVKLQVVMDKKNYIIYLYLPCYLLSNNFKFAVEERVSRVGSNAFYMG